MKYSILLILFFTGCSTFRSHVHYDNANQNFLNLAIKKLDIGAKIIPSIPTGSSLVIRSMEHPETLDEPVLNLIEDYLVGNCLKSNFKVLERDQDIINKMIKERSNYSILEDSLSENTYYSSHLTSAKYILSYRILECGIRTSPITRKKLYREALVRLHIRLIDAKTGEIKLVRNIASLQNDEVTNHMNDYYKNFHYSFFDQDKSLLEQQGVKK